MKACIRFLTFTVEAAFAEAPRPSSLHPAYAPRRIKGGGKKKSRKGKKKERKKDHRIWLPLPSSACVFRLATGIWMKRAARLPEPCAVKRMMSLRFHHYRLQTRLLWMAWVSSHACLAKREIMQKKFLVKNADRRRENQTQYPPERTSCFFFPPFIVHLSLSLSL